MGLNGKNFVVKFKNHRCGYGKLVLDDELGVIPDFKTDENHYIYVLCDHCDEYMDYEDGWWICPLCGVKTKQQSAYSAAGRSKPPKEEYNEYH